MSYGGAGYTSSGADEQQRYGNGTSYPTGVNGPMVYRPLLEDGINASHGYGKPLLPPAELNGVSGYGKPLQPPPGFSEQARYGNPVLMPPRINAPHGYDRTVPIPPKGNVPPVFNGQAPPPFGNNCAATVNNGSATVNNVPATVNNRSYDGIEAGVPSINNNEIASCTYGTSQVGHNGTLFQQTNGGGFVNHGRAGFDNLNTGNDKQFNLNSTETDNCFNGEDSRQNFNAEDSQKDKKADDRFNLLFGDESRFQALCNKDHYQVYQSQMEVIKSFYKKALSNLKDNQLTSLPDIDETFFNLKMISREGKLDSYIVKGMKKHVETDDNVDGIFGFCKLLQAYTDQRWLEDETEDSDEIVSNLIHQDEPTSLMYGLDDERYNSTFKNAVKWEAVCKPEHLEVYKSQVEILRRFYKVCRIALMKKDLGMELHEFDETIMDCIEDATFGNLDNYMVNALKRVLNDKCRNNDKLLEAYYALVAYRLLKYQGEDSRPNVRVPRDHEKAHQDTAQCHQETAPSFETNQYTEGLASALDCPQHTSEFERLQQFYEAVMTNPNTGNDKQFNLNSTETNNRVSGEDSQKDNKADDRFNLLFGDESRFQALCNKDHYQVYQSQMEVIKSFYKKALSNLKGNQFTSPEFDEIFFNLKMISREGKLDNYILKRMKEVKTRTFYYANDIFGFCKLLQAYTDQRFLEDETEDSDDSFSNLNYQDESTFSMYGPDDERYNSTFKDAVKWEAECEPEHLEVYRRQVGILRLFYKLCRIALVKKVCNIELHEFDVTIWAAIDYAKSGDLDNYMVKALKRVLNDKCRNDAKLLEACYALEAYNSLKYLEKTSRSNVTVPRDHEEAHQDTAQYHQETAQCHQETAQCHQDTAPSFETNQNTGLASALNGQQHTSEFERLKQFYEAVMTKLRQEDYKGVSEAYEALSKDLKAFECSEKPELVNHHSAGFSYKKFRIIEGRSNEKAFYPENYHGRYQRVEGRSYGHQGRGVEHC